MSSSFWVAFFLFNELLNHYKMIKANDPKLKSWIEVNGNSEFPIQNIPFGSF
jgi:hypothetical protein